MTSCYNLIGKQILSLVSGKIVGIVSNIEIKNSKITKILAFNDESLVDEEFLLNAKDVFSFGDNAITLKKEDFEINPTLHPTKTVGATVFNQQGLKLDSILDITFDEQTLKIINYIGEQKTYSPNEFFSISNGVAILKGNAKIARTKKIENLTAKPTSQVKILNNEIVVDKNIVLDNLPVNETNSEKTFLSPKKALANFNFLVGRIIVKTTCVNNGKTFLNAGQIVDQKTVLKAFENNFLKDLLECSKAQ